MVRVGIGYGLAKMLGTSWYWVRVPWHSVSPIRDPLHSGQSKLGSHAHPYSKATFHNLLITQKIRRVPHRKKSHLVVLSKILT